MGLSWPHEPKNDSGLKVLMVMQLYKGNDKYVVRKMAKDRIEMEVV